MVGGDATGVLLGDYIITVVGDAAVVAFATAFVGSESYLNVAAAYVVDDANLICC